MTRRISVSHHYDVPAQMVWDINTNFASFARLMRGLATFEGMPTDGQVQQGHVLNVQVRLLGVMPKMDYRMELLECDHVAYRFVALESGGSVKSWFHESNVVPDGDGCVLTDTVDIDAGLLTYPTALWGRYIYQHRHKPRLEMIAEQRGASYAS